MIEGFEKLTTGVSRIYKSIQKIKKTRMNSLGLKGTHVMCIYYLNQNPEGLTGAELCSLCREDKSGISRILAELEKMNFIFYSLAQGKKKYRTRALLTEAGKTYAQKVTSLISHASEAGGRGLTEEERDTFYRVLFQIADNLELLSKKLGRQERKN